VIWKHCTLGDVCTAMQGVQITKSNQISNAKEGYKRYLYISDFKHDKKLKYVEDIYPKKNVSPNDLIVSNTGSQGEVYRGIDGILSNNLFKVSVDSTLVDKDFLFHFLKSPLFIDFQNERTRGSTQPHMGHKNFLLTPIPLPPLAEQQRIVAKLDAAFVEIDKAVENLKNKKMNLKKLIDSASERFFNNESFDKYELKDVCTFIGGSQPPKSEFEYEESENNIRLIQIRDYKSDKHIVYIPKDKARRFCTKDDVMIGRYGPPIFQILRGIEGSYNVALMKAIPKENILNDYLFYFLKNRRIQNFVINKSSRAAGQSGVNKDALEPYIINLPSLETQKNICKASKELELQATYLSNLYKKKLDNFMSLKSAILSQELKSSEAA